MEAGTMFLVSQLPELQAQLTLFLCQSVVFSMPTESGLKQKVCYTSKYLQFYLSIILQ
jgi:hypothetical protein